MMAELKTNESIQRFANNVNALAQPGVEINNGIQNALNIAARAGEVFHVSNSSGVSLGSFNNSDGFNRYQEFSDNLIFQGPYGVCKAIIESRIAAHSNLDDRLRSSLSTMLPDEDQFFRLTTGNGEGVALVDANGRLNIVAAVNPTITCFDGNQGNKQFAVLYVKFVNGVDHRNLRGSEVRVVMSVCSLDFSLAPHWHIETVTSNKKSLFRSSSSSNQRIVYTPAHYTHSIDSQLQAILQSRMQDMFGLVQRFDTFMNCITAPPVPSNSNQG